MPYGGLLLDLFFPTTATPTFIDFQQTNGSPTIKASQRGAALRKDESTGIESPLAQWVNSFEVQPPQPPHCRPEKAGSIQPIVNVETIFTQWQNSGWEVQYREVKNPKTKTVPNSGDDGTENTFINWFNAGWEIQYKDIKHPKYNSPDTGDGGIENTFTAVAVTTPAWGWEIPPPTITYFPHAYQKGASLKGDDGTQATFIDWKNAGWEIQPPPPPHRGAEKKGAILKGDDGTEAQFINWFNFGWEIQPWQPPHYKVEIKGSILKGDDGTQAQFIDWKNAGWEIQPYQPPHQFKEKRGNFLKGDDGIEFTFIPPSAVPLGSWEWQIQAFQPPAYPRKWQKWAASKGKVEFPIFPEWINSGWEIQPYQPQHIFRRNLDDGDRGIEAKFVFVQAITTEFGHDPTWADLRYIRHYSPSVGNPSGIDAQFIDWKNAGWAIQYQDVKHPKFNSPSVGNPGGTDAQFQQWYNAGWEIQYRDIKHPKYNSPDVGDQGNQAVFVFVPAGQVAWGFDIQPTIPFKTRYYRYAAIEGKAEFMAFDTLLYGWEEQSFQPPHRFLKLPDMGQRNIDPVYVFVQAAALPEWGHDPTWADLRYVRHFNPDIGDAGGIDAQFINWQNAGGEVQPWQPPHRRPEVKGASFLRGDDGTEAQLINWFNAGWAIQYQDIKHPKYNSPDIGDGGIEAVFTPPGFIPLGNWAFQQITPDFPFRYKKNPDIGDQGIQDLFRRFFPYGWEILPYQPQHLAYEKRGGAWADGDRGIEFLIQFPVPLTNWAFDNFLMVPSRTQFGGRKYASTIFGAVDAGTWPPGTITAQTFFDYIVRARRRARR